MPRATKLLSRSNGLPTPCCYTGLESATAYFYRVRAINALGQSVPTAIAFDQTHPQSRIVSAGETVLFHAGVEGAPGLSYQWRLMGATLPEQTNEMLTLISADLGDEGEYTVVIERNNLSFISNPATLLVRTPPSITSQPQDLARAAGMSAAFVVGVHGSQPLSYNWRKNGVSLGINAPGISFDSVAVGDQASYDVIITNSYGAITSPVTAPLPAGSQPCLSSPCLRSPRFPIYSPSRSRRWSSPMLRLI
jgi:hypothetical protein